MKTGPENQETAGLRRRAERALEPAADSAEAFSGVSPEEIAGLVYELQVYRIELEMQNDELRSTRDELEDTQDRYEELYDFSPSAYVTLSSQGAILEANLTCASLLRDREKPDVRTATLPVCCRGFPGRLLSFHPGST